MPSILDEKLTIVEQFITEHIVLLAKCWVVDEKSEDASKRS